MIRMLLSWFTGGVLDRVLKSVDHAVSNDTQRQQIRARTITRYAETAAFERADARKYRAFWLVWCLFSAPLGLWWAAICLDSVFLFSFDVADLPQSVKPYADTIFQSLFGSGGLVAVGQAVSSAIRGRK